METPSLPTRQGERPKTTETNPQSQIDQQPAEPLTASIHGHAATLDGVELAPSRRAPPQTIGFHLKADVEMGPDEAIMIDREFAHVHPGPDHSLHLVLPEGLREQAIEAGWAEPHPLAGQPTVSPQIVLVYAPRDADELKVVNGFVTAAWSFARGR